MSEHREHERIAQELRKIRIVLARLLREVLTQRLGRFDVSIHEEIRKMLLAPYSTTSDKKTIVTVMPVKFDQNGNPVPDPTAQVTVTSSDPSQVGVEANPNAPAGGVSVFLTTPLDAGSAHITISAPGYETDEFDYSYTLAPPPIPGKLNTVVGPDVADTP